MRFPLRIAGLTVFAGVLCTLLMCPAPAEAQTPARATPSETESGAPAPPLEPPALTAPAPAAQPAPVQTVNQAPLSQAPAAETPAVQDAPMPRPVAPGPVPEPPPAKKPSSGAAAPPAIKPAVTEGADGKPYVIGSLDVLYVRVWNNPNLTGMVDVRSDGMISLALIGELKADGLTVQELTGKLKTRLSDYLNNPEVDVQVAKVNSKKFLIVGEVGRQGDFPLIGKMTIFEALTNAGIRDTANKKKIYLMRGTKRFNFNYNEVIQGKHMEQDIPVENGDRIVVPQ